MYSLSEFFFLKNRQSGSKIRKYHIIHTKKCVLIFHIQFEEWMQHQFFFIQKSRTKDGSFSSGNKQQLPFKKSMAHDPPEPQTIFRRTKNEKGSYCSSLHLEESYSRRLYVSMQGEGRKEIRAGQKQQRQHQLGNIARRFLSLIFSSSRR